MVRSAQDEGEEPKGPYRTADSVFSLKRYKRDKYSDMGTGSECHTHR